METLHSGKLYKVDLPTPVIIYLGPVYLTKTGTIKLAMPPGFTTVNGSERDTSLGHLESA